MGDFTTLMARDGHEFQAYLAAPPGRPRGAVVVLQEIFGVNQHIRSVTDGFAAEGYTAIAPALFDRIRRGIQLGYGDGDRDEGRGYMQQLSPEDTLKDVAAAVAVVRHSGRVGTVGYCWGGALAYRAACELPVACAVVYYGNPRDTSKTPKCPVMYHFGSADKSIPLDQVERLKAAHPQGIFYVYDGAGHGFNCDQRPSYDADAAALARRRTLEFLARRLAGEDRAREDADEESA
ncbi:MAG: dienelactone hydrolase family protein [Gammaproteobacteria bacterium]|nr:dienelactone hydrolase family protein [Gammaproteobacteria bacterium]MDE2261649.1 dienelactone hydrolase family protein [Gammaproteobacteria bacterium]